MSVFNEREDAFEKKFAHDADLKFKAEARRNKKLGLWVSQLLGKSGSEEEAYVQSVIQADFEEAGDEDVFRKIRADLDAASSITSDEEIREKMQLFLQEAVEEIQT